MKVENGRKTETISIQRLLHPAKVPLSSVFLSGEEESRSNIFVCRILRSSTVERKTSNCRLLTSVLSLSAQDGKLRGSSRFSRTENGERTQKSCKRAIRSGTGRPAQNATVLADRHNEKKRKEKAWGDRRPLSTE